MGIPSRCRADSQLQTPKPPPASTPLPANNAWHCVASTRYMHVHARGSVGPARSRGRVMLDYASLMRFISHSHEWCHSCSLRAVASAAADISSCPHKRSAAALFLWARARLPAVPTHLRSRYTSCTVVVMLIFRCPCLRAHQWAPVCCQSASRSCTRSSSTRRTGKISRQNTLRRGRYLAPFPCQAGTI